jgi:hypothetical protein
MCEYEFLFSIKKTTALVITLNADLFIINRKFFSKGFKQHFLSRNPIVIF